MMPLPRPPHPMDDPIVARRAVAATLADTLHYGLGHVVWRPRPRLVVAAADQHSVLDGFPSYVREILELAALLREQARYPGPAPFLTLVGDAGAGCLTCAGRPYRDGFRCLPCQVAVDLALDRVPRAYGVLRADDAAAPG